MNTFPLPKFHCPHCGDIIFAVDGDDPPDAQDILICTRCGSVMKLDRDMRPAPFTEDEVNAMIADLDLMCRLAHMVHRVYFIKHTSN